MCELGTIFPIQLVPIYIFAFFYLECTCSKQNDKTKQGLVGDFLTFGVAHYHFGVVNGGHVMSCHIVHSHPSRAHPLTALKR